MWKIAVGFAIFAAVVLFVLMRTGADVDMGGETHGAEATTAPAPASSGSR
jgi:hypothetical protein